MIQVVNPPKRRPRKVTLHRKDIAKLKAALEERLVELDAVETSMRSVNLQQVDIDGASRFPRGVSLVDQWLNDVSHAIRSTATANRGRRGLL